MRTILLTLLLLNISNSVARVYEKNFSYKTYDAAKSGQDKVFFTMESTKAGFVTTEFKGFLKKYNVKFNLEESAISNAKMSFMVKSLDTDIDARNEKMYDHCFAASTYPEIEIKIENQKLKLGFESEYLAIMRVRGKEKKIKVVINLQKSESKILISGSSIMKLSELEIPDPSIWIASVNDQFKLNFKFSVELKGK